MSSYVYPQCKCLSYYIYHLKKRQMLGECLNNINCTENLICTDSFKSTSSSYLSRMKMAKSEVALSLSLHCSVMAMETRYEPSTMTRASIDAQRRVPYMATHHMEVLDREVLIICVIKHHSDEKINKQCQADTVPTFMQQGEAQRKGCDALYGVVTVGFM